MNAGKSRPGASTTTSCWSGASTGSSSTRIASLSRAAGWRIPPAAESTRSWSPRTPRLRWGAHLGQVVPVVISSPSGSGPVRRIGLKVVGIGLLTPGGGAGPDRQIPHVHRGDAGAHKIGGRRLQHRVPRGAAPPRCGRRGGRGAAVEFDRAILHRLPGLVAAPGRSQSVDTSRGPGTRCVRRRRRTGCAAPRHPTRRTPAEPGEHDLAVMRAVGPTQPRPPSTALQASSGRSSWKPSSPRGWRWRCPFSSRSGPSGPSTRIVA